ncbi:MAG: sulfotransferase [Rhodothermales bacterium]|nr:sulfotransferase [Rhodothermales bacterium]
MRREEEEPLIIFGSSRSGTTLLRLMLNAHPRIAVPHELKYFNLVSAHARTRTWRNPLSESDFTKLVDRFLDERDHVFEDIGIQHVRDRIFADGDRTIVTPYLVAARTWMEHYGKKRWGEKTPNHLFYADVLIEMFPRARFVYMMRDPRAVVSSMNSIRYFSEDSILNALNWNRSATVGYSLFETAIPESHRLTLRYEDLAEEPETTLKLLCEFIGEEFDEQMLEFYRDSSKYLAPVIRTENVEKAVTTSSIDRWRDELSASEIRAVENICREAMKKHGYEPELGKSTFGERLNIGMKTHYFQSRIKKNAGTPGHTVTYPMFSRFRSTKK